jgi:tRNA pseudouridine32 synthase/23S rRNA pseudouridine746 synthase
MCGTGAKPHITDSMAQNLTSFIKNMKFHLSHKSNPPLPTKDGVSPSYLWLPEGKWAHLLAFLLHQFPDVGETTWLSRLEKNEVVDGDGQILKANSTVKRGMCIYYYRELTEETTIPFSEEILFQDAHLLVVDKPHFLPVTPSGRFLHETLLVRLKQKCALETLSPIHRLDRETAGVMLFSLNPESRGKYQTLFQNRLVGKVYHALAPHLHELQFPYHYQSCMRESAQFFIMEEAQGKINSSTVIEVLERRGANSLYKLMPSTGKKHQLRVHLASLGAPIINDAFYPIALPCKGNDFSSPLQLLAKSITFTDPFTGKVSYFESHLSL